MKKFFYGINTVKNLILYKKFYINKIFLCVNKNNIRLLKLKKIIIENKICLEILNKYVFNKKFKKFNFIHQGIIALVKNNIFFNNKNKLLNIIKNKNKFFLILDNINSPYNLGSCIRTSVAANIDCIIISKNNSVSIENNIVHKISTGSIYKIFIFQVNSISNIINLLKLYKIKIIGTCTESNNNNNLYNINFNYYNSCALILGSEKIGMKNSLKKKCDFLINIPIFNINSLNISVAYGIIIFEILRKKKIKNKLI